MPPIAVPEALIPVIDFIRANQGWGPFVVFVLAFAESLAFFSLLVPATVLLWGIGAMAGASGIEFLPMWFGAFLGAALGDWVSYWLGYHYHDQIARMWPLKKYPDLLNRGHAFFEKYGALGVFFGRFIGPLRATVPLAAGACTMPQIPFQIANWLSAAAWAFLTLAPGTLGLQMAM